MYARDALDEFLMDCVSRPLRPASIRFYRTHVGAFVQFLGDSATIDVVTRSSVRRFFAHLGQRVNAGELSASTMAAYDRALRAFCAFCVAEGWLDTSPMAGRRRVPAERKLPDTWSLGEVRAILDTCGPDEVGVRDRAIIALMLDTGLRANEVCQLPAECLTWNGERGSVRVLAEWAKSRADRVVPVSVAVMATLQDWLAVRPAEAWTVFVSARGRAWTVDPLTPNGLNQMMRRRVELARLPMRRKLCHIWRHTFARMYVQNGGDVETLRRILGHQSIETTQVYLGFRDREVADQHERFSPAKALFECPADS